MKTVKTYKRMTAEKIIAGKNGETNGTDNMTGDLVWNYRTDVDAQGILSGHLTVCKPVNASHIAIEDVSGIVAIMELDKFEGETIVQLSEWLYNLHSDEVKKENTPMELLREYANKCENVQDGICLCEVSGQFSATGNPRDFAFPASWIFGNEDA